VTSTSSATATTASAKVLDITELLEHILLRTDFRTVLLAQRVNKPFRAATKGSIKLQKKLFFRPADSFEEMLEVGCADEDGIFGVEKPSTEKLEAFHPVLVNALVVEIYGLTCKGTWSLYQGFARLTRPVAEDAITSIMRSEDRGRMCA